MLETNENRNTKTLHGKLNTASDVKQCEFSTSEIEGQTILLTQQGNENKV
jgi:hypothetical protein